MTQILLLLIPFLFCSSLAKAETEALKSGVFNPPRLAPEFTLQSSNGGELSLTQARGKLVVLGFGFILHRSLPVDSGQPCTSSQKTGRSSRQRSSALHYG